MMRRRECKDCGADISKRSKNAKYCLKCARIRHDKSKNCNRHRGVGEQESNSPITNIAQSTVSMNGFKIYWAIPMYKFSRATTIAKNVGCAPATAYRWLSQFEEMGWILISYDRHRMGKYKKYKKRFKKIMIDENGGITYE